MPRAAERPTRNPVKLPGPVVTAMRSRAANPMPDWTMTRPISGINASAWPRFMAWDSCAISWPASVSSTAAAQASSAVSMARISMQRMLALFKPSWPDLSRPSTPLLGPKRGYPGLQRKPSGACHRAALGAGPLAFLPAHDAGRSGAVSAKLHRPDFDHVGHEMLQQVLDAVLQSRGR